MMRKPWKTRLSSIVSFIFLLTGSHSAMSKGQDKFEWYARDSAPKLYPMKIIRGTFLFCGETDKGLYIPHGGTIAQGWGRAGTTHSSGDDIHPLPDRLKIIYFSFAEKQFYEGEFNLPYDQILARFREGVAADRSNPLYSDIMVGVAPGGAVSVWVTGRGDTQEVFFGQANKVEINRSAAFDIPFDSKAESDAFIQQVLQESLTPAELASIKQHGVPLGLWARYRKRYDWRPVLASGHNAEKIGASFLNGERKLKEFGGLTWATENKNETSLPYPAPGQVSFFSIMNGRRTLFIVDFDDHEILAAFDKLSATGKPVYLEFEPRLPRSEIKIRARNDKEMIDLKKFVSKK